MSIRIIKSEIGCQVFCAQIALFYACMFLTAATSLPVHGIASSIFLIRHSGRVKMRVIVTIVKRILFLKLAQHPFTM